MRITGPRIRGKVGMRDACVLAVGATLATLLIGCSQNGAPATGGESAQAKSAQGSVSTAPAAPQSNAAAAAAASQNAKPVAALKAGGVSVQPVTPEEFKQIVAAKIGTLVLVDFWATWCTPCREKFPKTLALAKKYASQGLTAISVSMDGPEPLEQKKVLDFLQQENSQIINLANRLDDTEAAFAAFDIDGGALPHYKLFDRKGKIYRKFGGDPDHPFNEEDIERAVIAALKEK